MSVPTPVKAAKPVKPSRPLPAATPSKAVKPVKPVKAAAPPPGPQTHWADVADWYDRLVGDAGSEYHQKVVFPGAVRLLALQAGESAVDVACGQGALCRVLAGRGAQMTGVDAAEPLVAAARERGPATIRYQVGDARELYHLPPAHFAAAACVLAIQNMHPIAPVFQAVHRLLRPGGRFVMVMMHPCFRGPKETAWGWDPAGGVQYRRVDRYLVPRKSPIVTHPGSAPDVYTWEFHRPVEAYVKALRNAGMLVDAIEEWPSHKTSQPGPRAAAENQARKEIPMFMAVRALKVPAVAPTETPDAGSDGGEPPAAEPPTGEPSAAPPGPNDR